MLVLSTKDRDRLKVLHEVKGEHLTQRAAGRQLGMSDRWVRELLGRVKEEGDRGVVHRLRGRASNRRLPEKVRRKALELVQARYGDFGPTLASEYLAKEHQVKVSKETLRKWLIGAGLRRVKRRKLEEVHVWRTRRSCRGEMVQWDTSEHDWLEERGPKLYLVAMIDDASSQAYARFVEHDSTEENLRVLWGYLERWGRPLEFYTDKSSLFTVNAPPAEAEDEVVKEETTQIGRGLEGAGDQVDRGALAASQGAYRALLRYGPGPAGERATNRQGLEPRRGESVSGAGVSALVESGLHGGGGECHGCPSALEPRARSGGDSESCGGPDGDSRLHDSLPGEDLPDCTRRHPSGTARQSGAGGATPGWQPGGEVSRALRKRDAMPTPAPDASAPEAGNDFKEGSLEGRRQLDERLQAAEEPAAVGDHEVRPSRRPA